MSTRRIAFFGAAGGCVNACLAHTLQNGHSAIALARSPDKVFQQLEARKVPQSTIDSRLRIITGNVKDTNAVSETLDFDGKGVDTIISGIGGVPTPQFSLFSPLTTTESNICSDATNTILAAMSRNSTLQNTLLIVISANGVVNNVPRDYPLALTPLYGWLLNGIYDDKRKMEAAVENAKPSGGFVVVRPSTLTNGPSKGLKDIRQGTTQDPVQGYSISRDDVGLWMYECLVKPDDRSELRNAGVSITY